MRRSCVVPGVDIPPGLTSSQVKVAVDKADSDALGPHVSLRYHFHWWTDGQLEVCSVACRHLPQWISGWSCPWQYAPGRYRLCPPALETDPATVLLSDEQRALCPHATVERYVGSAFNRKRMVTLWHFPHNLNIYAKHTNIVSRSSVRHKHLRVRF